MWPGEWYVNDRGHSAALKAGEPSFAVIAEVDQHDAPDRWPGEPLDHLARWSPTRVLAECEAKRRIVTLHQDWPVLVETEPTFEPGLRDADLGTLTVSVQKRIAWLTEREYVARFGMEPPTTPILLALALPYAEHPDYLDEWRP